MNGFDALTVGGGPAGCAFAIELARNGFKVLVIEKSSGPTHKVCGEFISADSISLLRYIGIDIFASGANATTHLAVCKSSNSAKTELPFRAAALSRRILDEMLLQCAESSGAQIARGEMARQIDADAGGVRVRTGKAMHVARFARLRPANMRCRESSGRAAGLSDSRCFWNQAPGRQTACMALCCWRSTGVVIRVCR